MADDYYKILGVNRNASDDDIQKAYRSLARKYHPDVNENKEQAKERFQEVQRAYDVLSDSEKREMYDRYGSSFESMGSGGPGGQTWQAQPGGASFDFNDIDFSRIFGGATSSGGGFEDIFQQFNQAGAQPRGRRRQQPRRGADLTHDMTVPFKTAVTGGEIGLSLQRPNGEKKSITVKVPPGIEDGKKIRLRGQGEASPNGGPAGDILITVHSESHPSFQRHGKNLEVHVPVTVAEAALGAKVEVPTPKGTITLTIPSGTSSGKRLRIKGHGVAPSSGEPGDLYAVVMISLPKSMDEETKDLVRRLAERQSANPREGLSW